ncbi:MAG: DUF3105 domain-containing protein [Patescibacteria group bacterium]
MENEQTQPQNQNTPEQGSTKKDQRAAERAARDAVALRRVQMRKVKKIGFGVIVILLVVGGGYFVYQSMPEERQLGTDYSRTIEDGGQDHTKEGEKTTTWKSNPPVSGPHWPDPQRDGIYDKELPEEGVVHSLEHGRIWISYKPSIPDATKEALKELARKNTYMVVSVRAANETDVALAAWNHLDSFNLNADGSFDTVRVQDFIDRYRDKGPEKVPFMTGKEY